MKCFRASLVGLASVDRPNPRSQRRESDRRGLSVGLLLLIFTTGGCGQQPGPTADAERWPAADRLFDSDPQWVGGDGAYSIDLKDGRILWLFGDSFIARTPFSRAGAAFIRNSVAIQRGADPSTAAMRFFWNTGADDAPTSFAAEKGASWLWPAHGVRLGHRLLLFYEIIRTPPGLPPGEDNFEGIGWTAFVIDNVDRPPSDWHLEEVRVPATGRYLLGEALLIEPPWLYAYGSDDDLHPVVLARWPLDEVMAKDLSSLEWWCGQRWCTERPAELIGLGAPELSVHHDVDRGRYLMVQSSGVGPTTLSIRSAPRPEGPWSNARDLLRPPESFDPDAFVYAGKAHPTLIGADLVATYVDSERYFPSFVRICFP